MNNEEEFMLTTVDNPFNPFDDFIAWYKFDMLLGYDCCGTLAREAATSELFSDAVNEKYIREAADRICAEEPMIYRKVFRSDFDKSA